MAVIPEFYINAVTSIGSRTDTGVSWFGTGFFILRIIDAEGNARPMLITNRHVLEGRKSIVLRLRKKNSIAFDTVDANLMDGDKCLYHVHSNDEIDIAVLPLNGGFFVENDLDFSAFDIDNHAMESEQLRQSGVDEGSLVHMLGFPMGLVNINSTLPICRLGCVARMSAAQIAESHNVLVDIQNFPGNSGSPIVTRPEIVSISGTPSFNKSILLGIVHSYIPYQESLINSQTKKVVEIRSENSGIALVHPVEYIKEIVDMIASPYNANIENDSN